MIGPALSSWRRYLRFDPTRFLLDAAAPPSVWLWFSIDIANRPEEARANADLRERILFSDAVQTLFSLQAPEGYWGAPERLVTPRYEATVWNLALLAEFGIPRDSRRARAALEYVWQNGEAFREEWTRAENGRALGEFLRAAFYFRCAGDERAQEMLALLAQRKATFTDSALAQLRATGRDGAELRPFIDHTGAIERVLSDLARSSGLPLTWPQFETHDELTLLGALAEHGALRDPRAEAALTRFTNLQDARARWPLQALPPAPLSVVLEPVSAASSWITLNAVRVIKAAVMG